MPNIFFELDKLRVTLRNKGLDSSIVENIVNKASHDINMAFQRQVDAAMQLAIEAGVQKRSADFINELQYDNINMQLITDSGNMEFSDPPYPMLSNLLKNAKPIKDGSGVYKVIPIGSPSTTERPKVSTNIYDAYKQVSAQRIENARTQAQKITPGGSKGQFRTATSKQDANTKWVKPATEKDFTQEIQSVNKDLESTMEDIVFQIIRSYEEGF